MISSVQFWDYYTVNFRVPCPDWPHPFLNKPNQKMFDQFLTIMTLHQHAKNQFIPFAHSSQSNLESHHMTGHIHFWPNQPLNFQHCFNLHKFVPACKKSVNSWDTVNFRVQRPDLLNLLWRNSSFRNYAIWLAESILAYISGTRFFPNIGFVQEHSK